MLLYPSRPVLDTPADLCNIVAPFIPVFCCAASRSPASLSRLCLPRFFLVLLRRIGGFVVYRTCSG